MRTFTHRQQKLQVGDIVRRKGDNSGRTRAVKEIYSGGHIIMLDGFLDGWLIWDISKLELVARAPVVPSPSDARQAPSNRA